MEQEKEALPPDEVRCKRNDGRTWRCKRPCVPGKAYCDPHLFRSTTPSSAPPFPPFTIPGPQVNSSNAVADVDDIDNRVPQDNVVADVEERENGAVVVADMVVVEERDDVAVKRGLRVKRPNAGADVEDEGAMRGPRVKRALSNGGGGGGGVEERCSHRAGTGWRCENTVRGGFSLCHDHLGNSRVNNKENGKEKRKAKKDKYLVEEGLPDELRCTRNDGRDWRCKRRVFEGEILCEAHFKGIKLADVKPKLGQNPKKTKKNKNKNKKKVVEKVVKKGEVEEEEEAGSRLAMVADVAVAEAEAEAEARGGKGGEEEEWRCKRTDGRSWRCKRRVSEGKLLCEIHYEQAKLRQQRITVPDSIKIQKGEGGERIEKRLKRKRALEILENNSDKGMKRMKAELIRVFLRREIIEQNKKKKKGEGTKKGAVKNTCYSGEITRDLPYGLMEIPPAPPSQILQNARSLGIKVGVHSSNSAANRRFRSKNIEPQPVGALKVVPFAGNVGKLKNGGMMKCHWCQNSDKSSLTKCLSCGKLFFCAKCIKERDTDPEEVKVKCPVCLGSCDCKTCCLTETKDVSTKEIVKDTCKGSKFHQLPYLIQLLLPILEQINEEQNFEIETEARFKGQDLSEVEIRQADIGCRDQCYCNNCKSPILDFHRSCPNCSYNLCLSCCREYSQGGCRRGSENSCSQPHNVMKALLPGLKICSDKTLRCNSARSTGNADLASASLSESTPSPHISCPPMELGGCDNSLLDLRCIFPLNWTKELEISAKELASGHELPQTTDDYVQCSLCARVADDKKEIQEASRRTKSHDNYVYCPSSSDDCYNVLAHFQEHWRKGHPVKVRNVLQSASTLSLDPLAMFCSCLENITSNCVNRKHGNEDVNCTDWYEAEIGTRESFTQSLEEECTYRRHKTLRVMAKLSPIFSRRLLEDSYSKIIQGLPFQQYTNPNSGLLNIAGKLPEDSPESKLGPCVCMSFGSREVVARGELFTKLHYNSYDVVNILAHVRDVTCSTDQLSKISWLIRQNNKLDQISHNLRNGDTGLHHDVSGDLGEQKCLSEGTALGNGVISASCCSPLTNDVSAVNLRDDKSIAKLQNFDPGSDASVISSVVSNGPYKAIDETSCLERLESCRLSDKRPTSETCGVWWDVFRRQDVPKLLEYIKKHVEELNFDYDLPKNVVHPMFDGSFFLDSTQKMQLKEEYDIEPWTFNQCIGEAVFIPAGCPYQMRYVKSCVNIALGFISPENASECIKLINEIRTLPNNHKAKELKLEVEKMTICSIDEAIKEIYRLSSEESSLLDKGG